MKRPEITDKGPLNRGHCRQEVEIDLIAIPSKGKLPDTRACRIGIFVPEKTSDLGLPIGEVSRDTHGTGNGRPLDGPAAELPAGHFP